MGRFQVMTMTSDAARRVREIVSSRDGAKGIRVGVKKGGCAGMEYTVDLVSEPDSRDDHVEHEGAHVYVAPEASLFLLACRGPRLGRRRLRSVHPQSPLLVPVGDGFFRVECEGPVGGAEIRFHP